MKKHVKRVLTLMLIFAMLLSGVPVSYASGESAGSAGTGEVLFENNFDGEELAGLENEALAEALFGEGNYLLGHSLTDAQLRIEDGALRLIGDTGLESSDDRPRNNRTQLLLASDERISELGVVIECDYRLNEGSANAFTFASQPVTETLSAIESNIWIAGIWSNAKSRTALRTGGAYNTDWVSMVESSDASVCGEIGVNYQLRLEVSPEDGLALYARREGNTEYTRLGTWTDDFKEAYGNCLDDNVRLILQCDCDVTIDSLKVSLRAGEPEAAQEPETEPETTTQEPEEVQEPQNPEEPAELAEGVLFYNDFNGSGLAGLENETLAEALFGEGNYLLGHSLTDAQLRIEDGALRLIGDTGLESSDDQPRNNRTQLLLASDERISEQGVVIECDYRLNEGSANAFTFTSQPVTETLSAIESNIWIAGIWSNAKSRTALRTGGAYNTDWVSMVESSDVESCGEIGVNYQLRLEVSPEDGLALYARREGDTEYTRLGTWTDEFKEAYGNCLDDNVRLVLQCDCDVTIDNLTVSLREGSAQEPEPAQEPETPAESTGAAKDALFYNNFDGTELADLENEELAEALFGEGNYLLGHSLTDAQLRIEDGALRLIGDTGLESSDDQPRNNRTQLLLASDERISEQGVVIECDYRLNEGSANAFTFASQPVTETLSAIESNIWIAGIWSNAKSRTALRTGGAYNTDWVSMVESSDVESCGEIGVNYKLRLEVSPEDGLALYARREGDTEYTRLGTWTDEFKGAYSNCLDDNVRLILQCDCDVTIDNLAVYPMSVASEPYVEQAGVKVNGEDRMLAVGEMDLSTLTDGEFLFAVVDGSVTVNSVVDITSDTKVIDIYTLTVDTLDGAALRTTGTPALRWMSTISTAEYDALMAAVENGVIKDFEIGTLIIKWEDLGRSGVLDMDQIENGAAAQVFDGEWIESDAYKGRYLYAGVSEDISEENYNVRYCGVGYGTVTLNNNRKLNVYGGFDRYVHARSASQVASTAWLDENSGLSQEQRRAIRSCAQAYAGAKSVDGMIRTLPLVENGKSNYEIVIAKDADAKDSEAASQLRTALGSLTGVSFTINTDTRYNEDTCQILVGNTRFAESEEALSNLKRNQSCIRVVGNKIVINSFTGEMLQEAIREWKNMLQEYVVQEEDGTKSLVAEGKEEVRMTNENVLLDLPEFRGGTYVDIYENGSNNMQLVYSRVDSARIDGYLDSLADAGFEVKEDNTVGANRFVTCVGEAGLVHLSYFNYNTSLSIITDTLKETVYKETEPEYEKITDTTLAVMSLDYSHRTETDGNGESYVITLEDGRYIIIDGGYTQDAEGLYQFLSDNNKRTDGNIVIAAWFLSHSHADHYGCFGQFASAHGSEVTVEYLVASTGISSLYSNGYDSYLPDNLPGIAADVYQCKIIRPHTGQTLTFCNTQFQMLYTPEDYAVRFGYGTITSENNASLVFKMTADGQTVLFTNDAEKAVSELLCDTYGEELKSDIFQMNHHGVGGCTERLCRYADPDYSLWTTNQISFDLRVSREIGGIDQYESNLYMIENLGRENCFIADGDVEIISFPLENKETDITYYTVQ